MSSESIDADQRITHDLEKLTTDLSGLVTGMVKPSVDIIWWVLMPNLIDFLLYQNHSMVSVGLNVNSHIDAI